MTLPRSRLLIGLAAVAVVIGFLNFAWFFAESSTVGDATRGYVRDGRYFLVHAGRATEVSQEAFEWSAFHARSVFVTHPLAMIGGAYLVFTVAFPAMIGAGSSAAGRERVERIRASGQVLASTRTAGKLGELRLTRPLIKVEVFPAGVVLSPIAMSPIGIDASSIVGLVSERVLLSGPAFGLSHRQLGAPRIQLFLTRDDPVSIGIRSIAGASVLLGEAPPQPQGRSTQPYSIEMKALILIGFALAVVFAVVAIPFGRQLGSFGVIWTIGLIAILSFNVYRFFIRDRDRW